MIYCLTVTPSYAVSTGPLLNLTKSPFLCQLVDSGWKLVDDVWCNRCSLYSGSLVSRCGTALLRQTADKILHMMAESWFSTLLQHADARASWLRKGFFPRVCGPMGFAPEESNFLVEFFPIGTHEVLQLNNQCFLKTPNSDLRRKLLKNTETEVSLSLHWAQVVARAELV